MRKTPSLRSWRSALAAPVGVSNQPSARGAFEDERVVRLEAAGTHRLPRCAALNEDGPVHRPVLTRQVHGSEAASA